jgi:hypothetical protein
MTLIELCAGSAALTRGLCSQPKLVGFVILRRLKATASWRTHVFPRLRYQNPP